MSGQLYIPLEQVDPEIHSLVSAEKVRQRRGLELIASENFTSTAVLEILSSCLANKYSEGMPQPREFGSNKYLDCIEHLCQRRALQTFNLAPEAWGVNVQPHSGTPAIMAVYTGLLNPHDRIMYLELSSGGHMSHGFRTAKKKVTVTSLFYESMPYRVDPVTELIDYDKLAENARLFKPKLIIAGVGCYPRCLDYKRFRAIADEIGAYLVADMGHIAGLVAAGIIPSPFKYCDVVCTTTHKTLRGPRAGVIYYRKGVSSTSSCGELMYDLQSRIGQGVFPRQMDGPGLLLAGRSDLMGGIATSLLQAQSPDFREYQKQVVKNAKALCTGLQRRGYKIATDGTDIHLLLVDLRGTHLSGAKAEFILEKVSIVCNRNAVPGDTDIEDASGIRLGTPAMTTRGLQETEMERVAEFIDRGLKVVLDVHIKTDSTLTEFKRTVLEDKLIARKVKALRKEVEDFAERFPVPSFHKL